MLRDPLVLRSDVPLGPTMNINGHGLHHLNLKLSGFLLKCMGLVHVVLDVILKTEGLANLTLEPSPSRLVSTV